MWEGRGCNVWEGEGVMCGGERVWCVGGRGCDVWKGECCLSYMKVKQYSKFCVMSYCRVFR